MTLLTAVSPQRRSTLIITGDFNALITRVQCIIDYNGDYIIYTYSVSLIMTGDFNAFISIPTVYR